MSQKNGSSPKHITEVLQSSRSSSSEYNDKNVYTNEFKVKNKVKRLLEAENPVPIIERIKSIIYIDRILTSMENPWLILDDNKKRKKDNVINGLIQRRLEVERQMKQKEEAMNIEELSKYKAQLKRLQTKLEKLLPLYIREDNSKKTIAILEKTNIDAKDLEYTIYEIKKHIESQERMVRGLKEQVCSRILTPKQVGPICWFMATFVAMFYSQRNRKVLLNASKRWDKKDKLFTLLKQVLDDKYLKSDNEKEDYEKFSDDTFGNILGLLFNKDSKSFPYNPKISCGFKSQVYICKLYNLLGVDCEMFDYIGGALLTYSYLNKEYDIMDYIFDDKTKHREIKKEYETSKKGYVIELKDTYYTKNKSTPTILILRVCVDYIILGNRIYDDAMYIELTSMREEIEYNGKTYILDSVILADNKLKHSITGITCKGIKYIYNGWTRTSMDPAMTSQAITQNIPCGLQRHDWKVKTAEGNDFCLNTRTCLPDILSKDKLSDEERLCFNFSEGDRMLIYVRKDKHLEKLNKAATTLHATIRRSVAQDKHLEKLKKATTLQATIRRRSVA